MIAKESITLTIPFSCINRLQVESIKRLIEKTKHAHMIDVKVRINGKDEWFEADWIKYSVIGEQT